MFDKLTSELLDLTASVKGRPRDALYAMVQYCSSCCCSCGSHDNR